MPKYYFDTAGGQNAPVNDLVGRVFDDLSGAKAHAMTLLPVADFDFELKIGEFQTWSAIVRNEDGDQVYRLIMAIIANKDIVAPACEWRGQGRMCVEGAVRRQTAGGGENACAHTAAQFCSEQEAQRRCPGADVVWVNTKSKIYHKAGSNTYGYTKTRSYICESDATAEGDRASANEH